jgi:hypothetical protein
MILLREQVFVPENRRSRSLTKSRLSEIIHAVWDAFALGNTFTLFKPQQSGATAPVAIRRLTNGPPVSDDQYVEGDNAGLTPLDQPQLVLLDDVFRAVDGYCQGTSNKNGAGFPTFRDIPGLIPGDKQLAQLDGMAAFGAIVIAGNAVDIHNPTMSDLAPYLAGTPFDINKPEGLICATNRWANAQQDADGHKKYAGGFPNFQQQNGFRGVVCIKIGFLKTDFTIPESALGSLTTVQARFAAFDKYCAENIPPDAEYAFGWPTFEQGPGKGGVIYGCPLILRKIADRVALPKEVVLAVRDKNNAPP